MQPLKYCPDCEAGNAHDAVACMQCGARFTWRDELPQKPRPVTVVDFDMKFTSMVIFMIKWAIAAIPAMIILFLVAVFAFAFLGGIGRSIR